MQKQLLLFFFAACVMAIGLGIHESIFNNFLSDTYGMSADQRGWLEFPRELPGLLVVLMTGVLCMLPVTQVGVIGGVVFALGMAGMALWGGAWFPMLAMMLIASAGMHIIQPVASSIILGLSDEHNRGRRMGEAGAITTLGMVIGAGGVWLLFSKTDPPYRMAFFLVAGVACIAALVFAFMHIPHLHQPRSRFVVKKAFRLYYLLEFFFGARKQIFLTFGPWVLIKVYALPASSIAGLMMTGAIIGVFFKPLAGRAIDHFGERTIMVFDGLALSLVCLGYGYSGRLAGDPASALRIASVCYILDNLLFALGHARSVYLSRLTQSHQELTSSLAMGVSINHIASMLIPAFAGLLWVSFGYEQVFLAAAGMALTISAISCAVPGRLALRTAAPPQK